jgi:hypothetical protein
MKRPNFLMKRKREDGRREREREKEENEESDCYLSRPSCYSRLL